MLAQAQARPRDSPLPAPRSALPAPSPPSSPRVGRLLQNTGPRRMRRRCHRRPTRLAQPLGLSSAGLQQLAQGLIELRLPSFVAIGTSLPELAASAAGALKGEPEIAIGNVIGSNMFNMLGVLCLPGLIQPTTLDAVVLNRDCVVMLGLTGAIWIMAFRFRGAGQITRIEGSTLLAAFVGYQLLIFLSVLE